MGIAKIYQFSGIVVFHQNFQMFRLQQTKHDGETGKTCIKEKGVVFTVLIVVKRFQNFFRWNKPAQQAARRLLLWFKLIFPSLQIDPLIASSVIDCGFDFYSGQTRPAASPFLFNNPLKIAVMTIRILTQGLTKKGTCRKSRIKPKMIILIFAASSLSTQQQQ